MAELEVEVSAAEVGVDQERIERLGAHLRKYVDDGRLPGVNVLVSRGGKIVYRYMHGFRDLERKLPVESDTIYRFYSMTKPITSIAAMQLYEKGLLQLKDPISRWLPAFSDSQVFIGGDALRPETKDAAREITVHDLLTHTSGLTYHFHMANAVDEMYRRAGFDWTTTPGDLENQCDVLASLPLLFDPGTEWNYSYSTDVLGRVVEVVSGVDLDTYMQENVLRPLGMVDTGFRVPEGQESRFASCYYPQGKDKRAALLDDAQRSRYLRQPVGLSGGGGLVSTLADYHRFTQSLSNGGALDGRRIIGRKTLEFMTRNHLPGGVDLTEYGRPLFSETTYDGVGFGLGFSVVIDASKAKVLSQEGEFGWGGAASTAFWVDPVEDLTVIFLTQLLPSSTHPLRPEMKALVYQSLL
ncbi:MAG: serine hydrolase domain-containing protein [Acidimicrobiales bacterium]|jgi:CubicO group peptidase (beta-lactamase class C family)|nr:serine hydrolase domain-containing protein [Acidimicrobiales bacterium]